MTRPRMPQDSRKLDQEYQLQVGAWTLKTPGVYCFLECISCDFAFGVTGLPIPPEPTPYQTHHVKVICDSCWRQMVRDEFKLSGSPIASGPPRPTPVPGLGIGAEL